MFPGSLATNLLMLAVITFGLQTPLFAAGKVTVVGVPAGGNAMGAKTDAKGTIHLVFDTAAGPQYSSSENNGKSFSKPLPLVDRASMKPGLEFITWDMAVTPEGAVHVVMGTNAYKLKLPKDEWGYMYTRLLPGMKTFEPVRNINHKPSEGFSLAVGDNGAVAAVWMADKLFANISTDGGDTFGPIIEIDPALNPCNCCTTSAVYAADGRLAILYREETNNDRDMYVALWDQSQNKVTKTRVGSTPWKVDSCPMTYYCIARTEDGFVAAWPTKGDIYFAKLMPDGSQGAVKEIKTPGVTGMRTGILAIPDHEGRTLVAWKKEKQLGWQLYDSLGRKIGNGGSAASEGSGAAGVLGKNGDFILIK